MLKIKTFTVIGLTGPENEIKTFLGKLTKYQVRHSLITDTTPCFNGCLKKEKLAWTDTIIVRIHNQDLEKLKHLEEKICENLEIETD